MLIALKCCPSVCGGEGRGAERRRAGDKEGGMDKSQEGEYSHLLPNYSLENERPRANAYYTDTSPFSTASIQNKAKTITFIH